MCISFGAFDIHIVMDRSLAWNFLNYSYQFAQTTSTIITVGHSSRNPPVKGTLWGWVIEMIAGSRKFDQVKYYDNSCSNATADFTWTLTKSLPVNWYISKPNKLEA